MKHLKKFNENIGNKIYFFNPHDYGECYTVLSDSKENAFESLINYLHDESGQREYLERAYNKWQDSTVDNLPDKYTIDVFEYGQVLETENS